MCLGALIPCILQVKINMLTVHLTPMSVRSHSMPLSALNMAETHKSPAGITSHQTDLTLKCHGLGLQLVVNVPSMRKALGFLVVHTQPKTFQYARLSFM